MNTTETRVYRTDELNPDGSVRCSHLVRTTHPNTADSHVARKLVRSRVASQDDLLELRELTVEIPETKPPRKVGAIRVAFTIPKTATDEARAAGQKYLQLNGERATEEGLKAAMLQPVQEGLRILPDENLPEAEPHVDPVPSFAVAETDASGKPTHLVVGDAS